MPPTMPRATLIEVARHADTSKTSVSRYFGPERNKLSKALCERIEASARALGYQPNQMARGLKGGGSKLLGMLVADIRNPFSVAIAHGVEQAARLHGYSLIVCNTDNDPAQEQRHLELLAGYQVEGLIINAAGQPESQLLHMKRSGVPVVLLDREIRNVDDEAIGLDNALAIDMALDHLTARGYRSLLYVSNAPEDASARRERLARFEQQCTERNLKADTLTLLGQSAIVKALGTLIDNPQAPCAVLCANGTATLEVAKAVQQLNVPLGPLGLMGIDELDWCALVAPGITTLGQPTEAISHAAVNRLLAPEASLCYRHPPRLFARGSTVLPDNLFTSGALHG
ncbi:LacI family DNA-binding transcriptional regulator [Vreelandella sp. EE22]